MDPMEFCISYVKPSSNVHKIQQIYFSLLILSCLIDGLYR